jgi:hypothetical protein
MTTAMAQEEEKSSDTTRFKIGSTEFIIIDNDTIQAGDNNSDAPDGDKNVGIDYEPNKLTYWSGLDFGVNVLMNNQFKSDFTQGHLQTDPASSMYFGANFFEQRIKIAGEHFGLVTGLGVSVSSFGFKNDQLRLLSNADSTFGVVDSTVIGGFDKNKLTVSYVNIPLLFQINTSKNHKKNFHLSFGIIGGVRIASNVKYKYEELGGKTEASTQARFNLNPFHASLTARLGYRNFGLFANFDMLSLYEYDKSRVAKPLTFGASFNF